MAIAATSMPRTLRDQPAATQGSSLAVARAALASAAEAMRSGDDRIALWRFVGAALEARQALQAHIGYCASPDGPVRHIGEARPRLRPAVDRHLHDHQQLARGLDRLIAEANSVGHPSPVTAEVLCRRAAVCRALLASHENAVHRLVAEWANREIGGEAG